VHNLFSLQKEEEEEAGGEGIEPCTEG